MVSRFLLMSFGVVVVVTLEHPQVRRLVKGNGLATTPPPTTGQE
jgi:hypothetical protein